MLYMIYSEWGEDQACIVNFIEGKDDALIWAEHFFKQYHDSFPQYIDFHWQDIDPVLIYTRDREFNFHPEPVLEISNGFASVIVVTVDHQIKVNEWMQILQFDANVFPWGDAIETHLDYEYLKRQIENN